MKQDDDYELNDLDEYAAHPLIHSAQKPRNAGVDTEPEPTVYGNFEHVDFEGEKIALYPADYEKVPVVRTQIAACILLFFIFGVNDQATGSLIPTLTKHYNVSELRISFVFFLQLVGYMLASVLNDSLHRKWGSQGVLSGSCIVAALSFSVLASKPSSLYLYGFCYLPLGLCVGFMDSTGNVYFGNLEKRKNEWMGALHGAYGLAAGLTPPTITMFEHYIDWASFFWIPFSIAIIGLILCRLAFKHETAAKYRYLCAKMPDASLESEETQNSPWYNLSRYPPMVYLTASYMFFYLGTEVSIGTWLFTYLLNSKKGEKFLMSFVTASFWVGVTFGRVALGFVTKNFKNEYRSSVWYGWLCTLSLALFALASIINSQSVFYFLLLSVFIFSTGTFIGPLFPNASVVAIQILPKHMQVSGIGVSVSLGGCGAAVLAFLFGYAGKLFGFSSFPILCLIASICINLIWAVYPRFIDGNKQFL